MWHYSNCEVQGRGHLKNNVPCQDKTKCCFLNDTYVIALSDGAGSAKLSHLGASCVVNNITNILCESFDDFFYCDNAQNVRQTILSKILYEICDLSKHNYCSVSDLAATLLAVAIKNNNFIIIHIGDGVIGYLSDNTLKVASAPYNSEYANETCFVTSKNAINHMNMIKGKLKDISGFVIMSDGTEQSLYNKKDNILNNTIVKLLQRNILINSEAMNLQLKKAFSAVITKKTMDDCSIALLSQESYMLKSFDNLSLKEKQNLYTIKTNDKNNKKRIKRYDFILKMLEQPANIEFISKKLYLKPKFVKKHLSHLLHLGLLNFKNGLYYSQLL